MFFSIYRTRVKLDRYTAWVRPLSGVIYSLSVVLTDQDSTRDLTRDRTATQPSVCLCPASSLKVGIMLYFFSDLFFIFYPHSLPLMVVFGVWVLSWVFGAGVFSCCGMGAAIWWSCFLACTYRTEKNPSNKIKKDYLFICFFVTFSSL